MIPKRFAQEPPRPGSDDSATQLPRGDDADSRSMVWPVFNPVKNQAAADNSPSLFLGAQKITSALDPLIAAKPTRRRSGAHVELHWRQPFAAHATAVVQDAAAAFRRIAAEKAVLTFAAHFRWLILALHKFCLFKAGISPGKARNLNNEPPTVKRRGGVGRDLRCRRQHTRADRGAAPIALGCAVLH